MNFDPVALHVPRILIPNTEVDLTRWAVIACDQYTSQPDYWEGVDAFVDGAPSTLRLILPEAHLDRVDEDERLSSIRAAMDGYLQDGTLTPLEEGFVLVERTTARGATRRGLVAALDLERYDFSPAGRALIRATEGTVLERLPVRVKIRSRASLELPHIMVLMDDPQMSVIEPLFGRRLEKVYDFDLMMNAGRLKGHLVRGQDAASSIARALERLMDPPRRDARSSPGGSDALLYAVGDGNHSLAAAKLFWEEVKGASGAMDHPARYALVELVNLHDRGIAFEPIHRVLFNVDRERVLDCMKDFFTRHGCTVSVDTKGQNAPKASPRNAHVVGFVSGGVEGTIRIGDPGWTIEAGSVQAFLDDYTKEDARAELDYIHGDEALRRLASREDAMGFVLPVISKDHLFETIMRDGILPRKAFSMGHADEKRFYMECRKIVP